MTKRLVWVCAVLFGLGFVVLWAADGPLTPLMNLGARTDSNGYLVTTSGAYQGPETPLTPMSNLRGRTDSNGYLITSMSSTTQQLFADGAVGAPSISFASAPTKGLYSPNASNVGAVAAGVDVFRWSAGGLIVNAANAVFGFEPTASGGTDVQFGRGAAGIAYLANSGAAAGLRFQFNGVPTIGTCGTSPSVSAGSTDTQGEVNVGTGGTATACGITFNATWSSAPRCVAGVNTATPANARAIGVTTTTTTAIFTAATAYAASDKVWWICIGPK